MRRTGLVAAAGSVNRGARPAGRHLLSSGVWDSLIVIMCGIVRRAGPVAVAMEGAAVSAAAARCGPAR